MRQARRGRIAGYVWRRPGAVRTWRLQESAGNTLSAVGGLPRSDSAPTCGGALHGRREEKGECERGEECRGGDVRRRLFPTANASLDCTRAFGQGRNMTRRGNQDGAPSRGERGGRRAGCRGRAVAATRAGGTVERRFTRRELYDACLALVRNGAGRGGEAVGVRPLALGWHLQQRGVSVRELLAACTAALNTVAAKNQRSGAISWPPSGLLRALLGEYALVRRSVRPAIAASRRRMGPRSH